MSWENKNVFVTGAGGFLGGWLVDELVHQRANVVVLIRDLIPKSKFYDERLGEKVVTVHGDTTDFHLVKRLLNEFDVTSVFHLAAQSIVTTANNSPLSTFESNIKGTWTLLEACKEHGVEQVVVASSDKAYGDSPTLPYLEDMSLVGRNPYDVSKSCSDLIAQMYAAHYGLPVCVTRCSNLFGGGDLNFSRVIPGTILNVLNGRPPVIKGLHFNRDFLYIRDAVEAYLTIAENMHRPEVRGQAFNLGLGRSHNIADLIRSIVRLMGSDIEPVVLHNTTGEISQQWLSTEKAASLLNWKPRYSLEDGLRETIPWYTDFWEKSKYRPRLD